MYKRQAYSGDRDDDDDDDDDGNIDDGIDYRVRRFMHTITGVLGYIKRALRLLKGHKKIFVSRKISHTKFTRFTSV